MPSSSGNLATFDDNAELYRQSSLPVHFDSKYDAQQWVRSREVLGGTELLRGLRAAARLAGDPDRYSMIVAITDALVSDDDRILANLRRMLG